MSLAIVELLVRISTKHTFLQDMMIQAFDQFSAVSQLKVHIMDHYTATQQVASCII